MCAGSRPVDPVQPIKQAVKGIFRDTGAGILEIRDESQRRLGAAFDAKAFHARLLEVGPVGLDILKTELART